MIATGLDRLLEDRGALAGRRYGLLSHSAAVAADLLPAQLALARAGADLPARLFGPEHGFFGVEQDMVASVDQVDPWLGVPIFSLYGDSEESLRPSAEAFVDLDLLVIDFQDVGARYYTYAATAVWAAEVALSSGMEVWLLDRPNPLGGEVVEGNTREPGLESFIGAFETPVRHALTLGELASWVLARAGADTEGFRVWKMEEWTRSMTWGDIGRRWIAPSPNMPSWATAWVYPGACLLEGTNVSEGRGTTRPFELFGSPGLDAVRLAERLNDGAPLGARFIPTYFRPQFQKHAGEVCAGVQWVADEAMLDSAYRCGIEIVCAVAELDPEFDWRAEPYEFVTRDPAIDLLAGSRSLRLAVEGVADLGEWLESWSADEENFIEATHEFLLYSGTRVPAGGR